MANHRKYRVEEEIKREVARMIQDEVKDPRISGLISVTHVEVAKDYRKAKIYVSCLAEKKDQQIVLKSLGGANGFIRSELASRLSLRFVPEIEFLIDHSIENGVKISKMLSELETGV
ncbi:MAG: 30S ribosome-binding factor RbfA [Peptococcaceae bacterium]|jgi:ribosome-binding factor A|nr:30S ribosome-binding factor RbfA [Peptococcaceae bacterium]